MSEGFWLESTEVARARLEPGSVACFYADPPYGTGRRFAHYLDSADLETWAVMIAECAAVAHAALADDGWFWLHLDDTRVFEARSLVEQSFDPGDFVTSVVWQRSLAPRRSGAGISRTHDILLVYRRTKTATLRGRERSATSGKLFKTPDGDERPWRRDTLGAPEELPWGRYGITNPLTGVMHHPGPGKHWAWSRARALESLQAWGDYVLDIDGNLVVEPGGRRALDLQAGGPWPVLYFGTQGTAGPHRKTYLSERVAWTSWWPAVEVGSGADGARECAARVGQTFSTSKPSGLAERIVEASSDPGDLVVDAFAGSGVVARQAAALGRCGLAIEANPETCATFLSDASAWRVP